MSIYPERTGDHEKAYSFRFRYETLRSLLNKNGNALQILSDLEADLNHMRHYDRRIQRPIQRLITESLLMAQELNLMTENQYADLYEVVFELRNKTDQLFLADYPATDPLLVWRTDAPAGPDPALVGGKAAGVWRLGKYFPDHVPPGFVATTAAYQRLLEENGLTDRIRILLNNLDVTEDAARFQASTRTIRQLIRDAAVSDEIQAAIYAEADRISREYPDTLWAVRSSAVSEDGMQSFAGQFDSELQIRTEDLMSAYLHVLAGRFTDRAVKYRIYHQFREVDTPMAVLFMPMVEAATAGVVYSSDSKAPDSGQMVISAVPGLANRMVRGEVPADTFVVSKAKTPAIIRMIPAEGASEDAGVADVMANEKILEIAQITGRAVEQFGCELDIEWAVDKSGSVQLLQARPLNIASADDTSAVKPSRRKDSLPVIEGGITIFPGRAEGPVRFLASEDAMADVPAGAVVLVEHPQPELAAILPKIAALLVMGGNPVGHLATLVREFSVPCIFRLGENAKILAGKNILSVNATKRTVYAGVRWPGIRERVMARIAAGNRHQQKSGPLYDLVLGLTLLDPDAASFRAKNCQSVHDTLRFMHEMSVRSMFGFGDKESRGWHKKTRKLITDLPVKFEVISLDHAVSENEKKVLPEQIQSTPFRALWRGISDERLVWSDRWEREMRGMPADFKEAVLGGNRGPRRASDRNYVIVARDYMNLNARFSYHYAMIDAMVGSGTEHNHVHFRFRGGGAADENRHRRALFLERVLRESGFGVDRTGDLVTAWFRRYPRMDSEKVLELLGRLMVCARNLDVVLKTDDAVRLYDRYFLDEQFDMFG